MSFINYCFYRIVDLSFFVTMFGIFFLKCEEGLIFMIQYFTSLFRKTNESLYL